MSTLKNTGKFEDGLPATVLDREPLTGDALGTGRKPLAGGTPSEVERPYPTEVVEYDPHAPPVGSKVGML